MISRRNYFAVTIVMFIIFFMFLSTGVITEVWNDYETNSYSEDSGELPGKSQVYTVNRDINRDIRGDVQGHSRDYIVYVGGKEMEEAVEVWASYTKKNMASYISLTQYEQAERRGEDRVPSMLVVDSDHVRWEEGEDLEYLEKYLDTGIDVVFCNMPDTSVIKKSRRIRKLFGIHNVKAESTTVNGVHLYDGFLLGGEAVYLTTDKKEQKKRQDMDLTLPWYKLEAGTEVYMKGIMKEKDIESEEYPVIIWKKNYRGACLMAVNGRYMEDFGGIGILSAMVAQMELYDLYPIVNAQSMVIADYPVLSRENEERLMNVYSRNMQGVVRDVLWPGIMTVYRGNKMGLSCMMAPQLNYEDEMLPDQEQLHYYAKNLNKEDTEVGLSGLNISDTQIREKLAEDLNWNIQNYWKGFREFQGATASESDEYIRRFLALDYSQQREGKEIRLQVTGIQEPVWFILRTHNEEIDRMEGGFYTKLEDDVFLLELEEAEAVITMKSTVLTYEY